MSLHPRFWRTGEEAILRVHYPLDGVRGVKAALLAAGFAPRSADAIYCRARDLGVHYVPGASPSGMPKRNYRHWTQDEEVILRAHYPHGGALGGLQHLPWRSKSSIRMAANRMGLSAPQMAVADGMGESNTFTQDS